MNLGTAWPVPYIISPENLAVDAVVSFCVSVLLAVTFNAEAQAFVATFLGDTRTGAKDRFHFNAFLHLDLLGALCYVVGGFGWPRTMSLDATRFKRPRFDLVLARLAGPAANLLMASIGGSLAMMMKAFSWDPRVFLMVVGVNLTTAVYNLIPLPPLAAGWALAELLPPAQAGVRSMFLKVGPYAILALALLDRLRGGTMFAPYFDPLIRRIFAFICGG
jgi:Zn-dependent protease